jgi:hypothetical protein
MIGLRHAEAHGEDQSSIKGCPNLSSDYTTNVIRLTPGKSFTLLPVACLLTALSLDYSTRTQYTLSTALQPSHECYKLPSALTHTWGGSGWAVNNPANNSLRGGSTGHIMGDMVLVISRSG